MKRALCFLLTALLLLSLTACGAEPLPTTVPTTVPTTQAPTTVPKAEGIRNIVLIIGDGMGPEQVEAGQLCKGEPFAFTTWQHVNVNTNSLDEDGNATVTTDSAASATALASGVLTKNGYVGKDPEGKDVKTILDYAAEAGRSTGILTTDKLTGATPGGFSGHCIDRDETDAVLTTQLYSQIDLLAAAQSATVYNYRTTLEQQGYKLCDNTGKVKNNLDADKMLWQLMLSDHNAAHKLEEMAPIALDYLDTNPQGFVLMIEQANIDTNCHNNEFGRAEKCVRILDRTVDAVTAWAAGRDDTVILVTADHETGGLSVSDQPEYRNTHTTDSGATVYYQYTQTTHSPTPVDLYVWGRDIDFTPYLIEQPGEAYPDGIIKNISVFQIMLDILQNP